MSTISRYSSRCLEQFAMTCCLCMPSLDVIRSPGYSALERSRCFNESSTRPRKKKSSTTVQKLSLFQSKVRMLWKPTVVGQWWHCSMQIRKTPWHLSGTICSARKLQEQRLSSHLNDSHQPPRLVNFIPCGPTTRLWSGWAVVRKWIHLSGDGG